MRSVCFVERIELEFTGNILQNSICLGDVDNDGETELVVGGLNGDLFVYKGDKLWQSITGLGMITGVAVGDVMNCGSNAVVVISGDGWCYIYLCLNSSQNENGAKLELVHHQRIPANTKIVILGDLQGEGQIYMVLGLTDRVVRIYRWLQKPSAANLICLNKCESANQIGSISLGRTSGSTPCILVSQPGATYMIISHREEGCTQVDYRVVDSTKVSNSSVSSQILGNIGCNDTHSLVTLDGNIMLIQNQQLLWSKSFDQQLFTLCKAKVSSKDREELVVCSWSGHTYIIDLEGNTVCFELGQPVQAFTSGFYTSKSSPSFVYLTFNNKIYVYYDIKIEDLVMYSFYKYQKDHSKLAQLTRKQVKEVTEYCLYGFSPEGSEKSQVSDEFDSSVDLSKNGQVNKNL